MKEIRILNVVAEGFRSLSKRTEVNLDRPGLNLIKGENGAGKTTIVEAIVWCLYGTNLKETTVDKIPTWEETRTEAFQGTYVELTVEVDGGEYKIVRTIGWSGGEGIGRDALVIRGQDQAGVHKKDVQAQIISLLGIDAQTFMSSILFGQRMPKLVESDNKDKRELFERLFETAFINDAKSKASLKLQELSTEHLKLEGEQTDLNNQLTNLENEIDEQERILEEFDDKKKEAIQYAKDKIQHFDDEINSKNKQIGVLEQEIEAFNQDGYDAFKEEMDELERKYNSMEETLEAPKSAYEEAKENVGKASRSDVIAETNVKTQKQRDEQWVIDKAGAIADLKEELANLMNKKTDKLNDVSEVCYACGQDLKPKGISEVKQSIEEDFAPQLEAVDTRLTKKQAEKPPVSNIEELMKIREDTIKELESAQEKAEKAMKKYGEAQEAGKDLEQEYRDKIVTEQELDDQYTAIREKKEDVLSLREDIKLHEGQLTEAKNQLEIAEKQEPPKFSQTTDQLITKHENLEKQLKGVVSAMDDIAYEMNLHQWWTKKGFVSSGLPAFVFKAMLENLNEYVKQYSDRLGVSIEFSIDLTKATKPFTTICSVGTRFNKEYKEFSGGQKQRLDIALIFAMHDLVSADADINILIMDEVFEGLDEAGEAAVFDLIRMKAEQGKSIYIITHSPHIDSLYSSTLTAIADETGATIIIG
jgi:DNA repair exonuclease SbcCD ATPase subunit